MNIARSSKYLLALLALTLSTSAISGKREFLLDGLASDSRFLSLLDHDSRESLIESLRELGNKRKLVVTATAYTSHVGQTDSTPDVAAWGDKLAPHMKVIAVSRDLLHEYGLERGTKVKIHGLPGQYVVLDKMNSRWRKKIDIYMGKDLQKAYQWGKQEVTIEWPGAS